MRTYGREGNARDAKKGSGLELLDFDNPTTHEDTSLSRLLTSRENC